MRKGILSIIAVLATLLPASGQILDSLRIGASSVQYKVIAASAYEDFGATNYNGDLLFVSSRGTNLLSAKYEVNNQKYFELFLYDIAKDKIRPYSEKLTVLEGVKYHFGPSTLLPDSSGVIISRNYKKPNVFDEVNFFLTELDFEEGTNTKLPFIKRDYSYQHPYYDAKSRRLYFSSNIPGGQGGYDLYYSEFLKDSTWGAPVAVPMVNGPRDEVFPTIGPKGTLYFSKTVTKQGLDLFAYDFATQTILPFNPPMSTSKDEFSVVQLSRDSAVFSQSQRGRFNTDLVLAWVDAVEAPAPQNFATVIPLGEGQDPWASLDSLRQTLQADSLYVASINGRPVLVVQGEQVPENEASSVRDAVIGKGVLAELTQEKLVPMDRPVERYHVVYNIYGSVREAFATVEDWKTRSNEPSLWLGEVKDQLVLVVTTDKELDEAQAKKQWAIQQGMNSAYLIQDPIHPVDLPAETDVKHFSTIAGVFENPKGALKQLEKIQAWAPDAFISLYNGKYYVVSADYAPQDQATVHQQTAVRNGVADAWLLPEKLYPVVLPNLKGSPDLVVYFRFDKYDVMDKYAKQIDDVMAKLPSDVQRVFMVGHTDSRGTNKYNEVLSTKRVQEVSKYITEKYPNFDAARELDARGEYELTNKCEDGVDCDPYAHFLNRRVEIWFY